MLSVICQINLGYLLVQCQPIIPHVHEVPRGPGGLQWPPKTDVWLVAELFSSGTSCPHETPQNRSGLVNAAFCTPFQWCPTPVMFQMGMGADGDPESLLSTVLRLLWKAWNMFIPIKITEDEFYRELFNSLMTKGNFSKPLLPRSFFCDISCHIFHFQKCNFAYGF